MTDIEAAETRLTFDDILEAVQDSKRGRWFLKEFEAHLHKRDTQSVLSAISRLESRMEQLAPQASSPDDLGKVRVAIANARSDLLKLGLAKDALSKEGRLFAEMAEMARKTMPSAGEQNAGIVRSLQLVAEIDSVIAPQGQDDGGARYFNPDENLFERPAAPPKPVLVPTAKPAAPVEVKKDEPASTGAKLVIRKASQTVEQATEATDAKPVEMQTAISPEMPAIDNPRIVIIRRRAEDMPEVGMEEAAESVSAA
jgi:hypothetical protein